LRNSREFPETCNPYCEVGVGILGPEFSWELCEVRLGWAEIFQKVSIPRLMPYPCSPLILRMKTSFMAPLTAPALWLRRVGLCLNLLGLS
jgi:hypothetical protein